MKLISFVASGRTSYGIVSGDGIIDLGRRWGGRYPTLRSAIAGDAFTKLATELGDAAVDLPMASVTLLPPIPDPDKIICVGLNYRDHAAESGSENSGLPSGLHAAGPTHLLRHGSPMICPRVSQAILIMKANSHSLSASLVVISRSAMPLLMSSAYTCFNDGSIRDYQFKHSLAAGKNFRRHRRLWSMVW